MGDLMRWARGGRAAEQTTRDVRHTSLLQRPSQSRRVRHSPASEAMRQAQSRRVRHSPASEAMRQADSRRVRHSLASEAMRQAQSRRVRHSPASEAMRGRRRSRASENVGGGARDQEARRRSWAQVDRALRLRRALSPGSNVSRRSSWCQAPPPASRTSFAKRPPPLRRCAPCGGGACPRAITATPPRALNPSASPPN